ncbi:hypothetical protein GOV07_03670 [Candidatus Woesearchaeota archaeon]|nr:hypothetical protein [Candidatus Woesearchaeota archaeon]
MVIIARINKDLDKYLSGRRAKEEGTGLFSIKRKKPKPVKEEPQEVPEGLKTDSVHVLEDREPTLWERLFKKEEEIVTEDLSEEEMTRLEAMEVEIERVEAAEEAHPEMVEELEEVRESLIDRFLNTLRGFQHRRRMDRKAEELEYIAEEVVPRIDEDVKRVLKLVHKWLAKLPKRARDDFKKSNDFIEYKNLLEKYGVAKLAAPKGEPKARIVVEGDEDYPVLKAGKK